MPETLEIPELGDENLIELTVRGRLRNTASKPKGKLKKLEDGILARVGGKKSVRYIDVFGSTTGDNHLHVDVMVRPPAWARDKRLRPLGEVQSAIMDFAGLPIDVRIIGEFIVEVSELPERGVIRSAMSGARHAGLTTRQTAQTLTINDVAIKELKWFQPTAAEELVVISLAAQKLAHIESGYLLECENFIVQNFNTLVFGGKSNAADHH